MNPFFYQRREGTWLFIRVLAPRSPCNATSGHLSPPIADVCKFTESLIAANFFWTFPARKTTAIARGMHSRPFMPPCTDRAHEQRTRVRSTVTLMTISWACGERATRGNSWFFNFTSYKTRISEPVIMSFAISDSKDKLYKLQLMKYHRNKYVIINETEIETVWH